MSTVDYTRRNFLKAIGLGATSLALPRCIIASQQVAGKDKHPNIVFIMSDDHASHAISCYGSKINKTPHLDQLAKEGMLFKNCFCTNSLCAPSRAAILTGKYSHLNGLSKNGDTFDGDQQTFPKLLQKAGYETAIIGKWHLKSTPTGFDYWNVLPRQGRYHNPEMIKMGRKHTCKGYVTDIITDESIQWIKQHKGDKPFCLLLHHKAPHAAHYYDDKHADMYQDDLPEPQTFYDDYRTRSKAASVPGEFFRIEYMHRPDLTQPPPPNLKGKALKKWVYQYFFKGYLRVVASIDDNVGKLLDFLDESRLAENTIVVYTSDQGFFLGDHGWYNKMWMYEQSIRMPLLIRYPKEIKPGSINSNMVTNIDFAPTFLDYAGVTKPADMQGRSIRRLLWGDTPKDWRKSFYYHYYGQYGVPPHYGIRTQHYKLIHFYSINEWELFDLQKDPDELNNIYNNPEYRSLVVELKAEMQRIRKQYGDVKA